MWFDEPQLSMNRSLPPLATALIVEAVFLRARSPSFPEAPTDPYRRKNDAASEVLSRDQIGNSHNAGNGVVFRMGSPSLIS